MTLLYLLVVNVPQRFHQDHSFTLWRPGSDLTSLQTTWAARRESQELHSTLDKKQQQTVQQSCPPEAWQIRGGNKKSYWRIHGKGWSDKVRARCKIFFRFFVQIQFYLLQKNVTKIKCTKWLSIDLAVHKERKKCQVFFSIVTTLKAKAVIWVLNWCLTGCHKSHPTIIDIIPSVLVFKTQNQSHKCSHHILKSCKGTQQNIRSQQRNDPAGFKEQCSANYTDDRFIPSVV